MRVCILWGILIVLLPWGVAGWKPLTKFEPGKGSIMYHAILYPRAYDAPWERLGYHLHLQASGHFFCSYEKDRMERAKAALKVCTESPGSEYFHAVTCAEQGRRFAIADEQLRDCRARYPYEILARLPLAETTDVQRRYFPFLQGEVLRLEEGQCYIEPSLVWSQGGTEFIMACIPADTVEWMETHAEELIVLHESAQQCKQSCARNETCRTECRKAFNKATTALNPPRLGEFQTIHQLRSHKRDGHCCASEWV